MLIIIVNNRGSKVSVRVKNLTGGKSHQMDNQGCSIAYKYNDNTLYMYVPAILDYTKVTCLSIIGSVSLLNIVEEIPTDATKVPYDGNV